MKKEIEGSDLREEVDMLKEKLEEVRKEVIARAKNKVEGGRNGSWIEHIRLNKVRSRREEGLGRQGEWVKLRKEKVES